MGLKKAIDTIFFLINIKVKHELTSEKAFLNRTELTKLQNMLFDLRVNLTKSDLVSSQFCSKLARIKIESYLHDFLSKFKTITNETYLNLNHQLSALIDILFYFIRKLSKPSASLVKALSGHSAGGKLNEDIYCEIDESITGPPLGSLTTTPIESDDDEESDEFFKQDTQEWLRLLVTVLLSESEHRRCNSILTHPASLLSISNIHFDNIFFTLNHLLRCPESYAMNFSNFLQIPLLIIDSATQKTTESLDLILNNSPNSNQPTIENNKRNLFITLNLNSSYSDPLVNTYLDFYLKLIAVFAYEVKYRSQFLFVDVQRRETTGESLQSHWELVDSDGDLESVEQALVDISEDDLVKLYYQIPFNAVYSFLWSYLRHQDDQTRPETNLKSEPAEFRKRYVSFKILSFLDYLVKLSIRTLLVYNKSKYKNFSKLVGKTLKDAIKFVMLIQSKCESNFQVRPIFFCSIKINAI